MAESEFQRIVLLNHFVSRSVSRAPEEHKPPTHSAYDLLQIVEKRRTKKIAIEYFGATDDDDEAVRAKNGSGHNFFRLRHCRFEERGKLRYAVLLFEFVDQTITSFPVVHTMNFTGREIAGEDEERGATSAHFVIRMPGPGGAHDDGMYRCALEAVAPITRRDVELFLSRQIRRENNWEFSIDMPGKAGKKNTKVYQYHPRFNLFADIGRRVGSLTDGRILTHMVFTKRGEKQNVAKPTGVLHNDYLRGCRTKNFGQARPHGPGESTGMGGGPAASIQRARV